MEHNRTDITLIDNTKLLVKTQVSKSLLINKVSWFALCKISVVAQHQMYCTSKSCIIDSTIISCLYGNNYFWKCMVSGLNEEKRFIKGNV